MISWCVIITEFVPNSDFRLGDTRPQRDCHGEGDGGCPADFSLHVDSVALC